MALKPERIKVEVNDSVDGETRTFKIILMAPNSDFQLTDLLRQRGVISPINGDLQQAVKIATQNYLAVAEALISTLAGNSTATPKSTNHRRRQNRSPTRISPALGSAFGPQQESTSGDN